MPFVLGIDCTKVPSDGLDVIQFNQLVSSKRRSLGSVSVTATESVTVQATALVTAPARCGVSHGVVNSHVKRCHSFQHSTRFLIADAAFR